MIFIFPFDRWFADPIFLNGDYPASMRRNVGSRLPRFSVEEQKQLLGSADFFALNHYTSCYCSPSGSGSNAPAGYFADQQVDFTESRNGVLIGPQAASTWLYVFPVYGLILFIYLFLIFLF